MVIKGYINIQMVEVRGKVSFYTGCDIHPDLDTAKRVAGKNTIQQLYIAFDTEDTKVKRERDMTDYHAKKEETEQLLQERVREKGRGRPKKARD